MIRDTAIKIRKQTWAMGALLLIVFCWLGLAAVNFGALFEGLNLTLPLATKLAFAYGPILFPLIGIVAAAAFIVEDVFLRNQWVQLALFAFFALLIILAVTAMLGSGIGGMSSTIHTS